MKKTLTLTLLLLGLVFAGGTDIFAQDSKDSEKTDPIVFKIPDGVMTIDWNKNDFKGMLMLEPDSPSGVFISYPNEGESVEDLKLRAAKFIFPMFSSSSTAKNEDYGKDESLWKITDIPIRKGDRGETAKYYLLEDDMQMTQILIYERASAGTAVVYGYFAKRNKDKKIDKNKWADEKGEGVKLFKKFWKSFS